MRIEGLTYTLDLPAGVTASYEEDQLSIAGPLGEVSRPLVNPPFSLDITAQKVTLTFPLARRREKALLGTWRAHLANMIKGVTEGFEYQLKMVFAHFPVKLTVKGSHLLIENFLGERHPRRAKLVRGTKVEVSDQQVLVSGSDKEAVGQTAANLERATLIKGFDPRVFQDGLYIVSKG